MSDPRQTCVYFPVELLDEIRGEAIRQDRSLSWLMQRAWKIARSEICKPEVAPDGEEDQS